MFATARLRVLSEILLVVSFSSISMFASARESILHNFSGTSAAPAAGLVSDAAGNFYGVTGTGTPACMTECGSVFKLSPNGMGWSFEVLHIFTGGNDGSLPQVPVTLDAEGNVYGTTTAGGGSCPLQGSEGCGIVFKLSQNGSGGWSETVLHRFSKTSDGAIPLSNLIFDASGNLYGTTEFSGATRACPQGCGTIYKLSPSGSSWSFSVIHTFNSTGGSFGGIIFFDSEGTMFGTTGGGGTVNALCGSGCGVVFKLVPSGSSWTETVLYKFTGGSDGQTPYPLAMDSAGNLFGTALFGGLSTCQALGCGTAFELSPKGSGYTFSVTHSFNGTDGQIPIGIIPDGKGNLFGTTESTGTGSCEGACGKIFKLAPKTGGGWTETTLHSFSGGNDGSFPFGGVILDSAGNLYGTAAGGGTAMQGVAFKITQ